MCLLIDTDRIFPEDNSATTYFCPVAQIKWDARESFIFPFYR